MELFTFLCKGIYKSRCSAVRREEAFRTWWTENTGLPCDVVLVGTCALQTGSREPGRDMYKQWGCLWSTVDTSLKPIPSITTATTTTNNNPLRRSTLMRVNPSNGDNLMNHDLHRFSCDVELLLYWRLWQAGRQTGCFQRNLSPTRCYCWLGSRTQTSSCLSEDTV